MKRKTRQRAAVRLAFVNGAHTMTPQDVLCAAQPYCQGIGIATVYRTLKELCHEGWLVPVELPGQRVTYYERAEEHHHHFVCRLCERLYRVHCHLPKFDASVPEGFQVEDHELLLYGVCSDCGGADR